ncbi:hypothetical protein ACQ4M3_37260 [Leptolyngbya sp. AN03gr2]|uniref:hypothetical protein n=1 Tax=unclassified Leptolyngbya TaxID=2650499 RepID=UPI003D31498F
MARKSKFTFNDRKLPLTVHFGGYDCWIIATEVVQHPGVVSKLQLWCDEGPMATATYGHPVMPQPQEVLIKSMRENTGLLEALIEANIVAPPHAHRLVDGELAPVCLLLC